MADDARDLYQDLILRHARQPLHQHRLDGADAAARGENPLCGDHCEVFLRYAPDRRVAEIGFDGRGCAISLASADLMAGIARDRTAPEIRRMAQDFSALARTGHAQAGLEPLEAFTGLAEYPSRIKCATLPWAALVAALDGNTEASSE